LGWWRVRNSDARLLPVAQSLRENYIHQAIHAAEHERQIVHVFQILRSSGIEPILIKGWAIARAYAESGLRPSGDIDLCVPSEQRQPARHLLNSKECEDYLVDLDHRVIRQFGELSIDELYRRSEQAKLGCADIRVLCAEDHLRILCLHLLKHGAWRPLWLCDVAAALESRPANFDWDRCLGKNPRWADWIACAIGLANRLLAAELGNAPAQVKYRTDNLPVWLVRSVLKQWSTPFSPKLPSFTIQMREGLWKNGMASALRQRWPNPIQATVDANGRFDNRIRLPFQVSHCISRAVKLFANPRTLQH
jgi:hypothetical protein